MYQGVLYAIKCHYMNKLLKLMLNSCNSGQGIDAFSYDFNIKDAVWTTAHAWDYVPLDILH